MEAIFKNISLNKNNMHDIKYLVEEQRGDATIKSTIKITLEDVEMLPSMPLEEIISKGAEIAKREYVRR